MKNYYDRTEISNSDIKLINKSLEHYICKKNFADSEAMILGKAFHCYILEPEKFDTQFIIKPKDMDFRSKENRVWRDDIHANGLNIIDESDYNWFDLMLKKLINHRLYPLISQGKIEVEKEIYFEYDGIDCRCKIDCINHSTGIITDYKTILSCAKAETSVKYDYASQAFFYQFANYCKTGEIYDVVFLFTEKSYPHGVKFIKTSAETLDYGKQFIDKGIAKIKEYRENPQMYLGYNDEFIIV